MDRIRTSGDLKATNAGDLPAASSTVTNLPSLSLIYPVILLLLYSRLMYVVISGRIYSLPPHSSLLKVTYNTGPSLVDSSILKEGYLLLSLKAIIS
jgi:hypothetical protein